MKRILQIVFSAMGTMGGQQTHLRHILAGLDRSLYETEIVLWDVPDAIAEMERRGFKVLVVRSDRILDIGLVRRLTDHIVAGKYDLVHVHGHRGGVIGRVAAIRAGAPHIVWTCHVAENKADPSPLLRWGYAALLRSLGRRTNATVAVSPELRDWLIGRGLSPESIEVIRNGVDCELFHPGSADPGVVESLGLKTGRPVVGTVARLTEQKGLDCLLRAARKVLDARPDAQFVVVGKGPLLEQLVQHAHELGVQNRVIFAGERLDIPKVIAAFDIAAVPSLWEGAFSYVPLEVMATRRPLICSDIPHFRSIISQTGAALLFPAGSDKQLATAILRLLDDASEAEHIAKKGYEVARRDFDVHVMQQQMAALYERLLDEKTG